MHSKFILFYSVKILLIIVVSNANQCKIYFLKQASSEGQSIINKNENNRDNAKPEESGYHRTNGPALPRKSKSPLKRKWIDGTYDLVTDPDNEDYMDYLKAMGYSNESQNDGRQTKQIQVVWTKLNYTHRNVKRLTKNKTIEFTFQPGQEFVAEIYDGRLANQSFTVDEENNAAVKFIRMDGFTSTHELRFDMRGFNITMKAKNTTAMFELKRVNSYIDSPKATIINKPLPRKHAKHTG